MRRRSVSGEAIRARKLYIRQIFDLSEIFEDKQDMPDENPAILL